MTTGAQRESVPDKDRDLFERSREIVSAVLGMPLEAVSLETSHASVVSWDSMNVLNLLLAIEAEFGIRLDLVDAAELVSVQDIVRILKKYGA
jgi:acyl carrier protein